MTTKTETITVQLYSNDVKNELVRMSSGYVGTQISNILNKKFKSVYDSETRKKFYEKHFEIVDNAEKDMVIFELVDNSTVTISPDYANNSLVFDFKVEGDEKELNNRLLALRETVLHQVEQDTPVQAEMKESEGF
jgi:hypothetical protein